MTVLPSRRLLAPAAALAVLATLAGCGSSGGSSAASSSTAASSSHGDTKLTVLAASSLTDVFRQAAQAYHKEHPGVTVNFSFAGSQDLVAQVKQGAPADGLVTADTSTMASVRSDTDSPEIIAKNRLVIVTAPGDPQGIHALSDLTNPKLKVVLAAKAVPVGHYSRVVLDRQHLNVKPVSEEANVRAVLSKVELGEADAGIVYATDAKVGGSKVDTITIPDAQNTIASYPAATLTSSKHEAQTEAFLSWLKKPEAQKLLRAAGFQKP